MTMLWFLRMSVYALLALFESHQATMRVEAMSYLETNEVSISNQINPRQQSFQLPECTMDSVCGYLQANVRGIVYKHLCACPGSVQCPMIWDPEDGHSVSQASEQYKFCGKAPLNLSVCMAPDLAYTSLMVYSKVSRQMYSKRERIHCLCPFDHNYVLAHQHFSTPDTHSEAVSLSYTCARLPLCKLGDTCKTITERGPEFLVNPKCRCPPQLRCPTLQHFTNLEPGTSFDIGNNGRMDLLRCQQ